jgi:hypothetical protein
MITYIQIKLESIQGGFCPVKKPTTSIVYNGSRISRGRLTLIVIFSLAAPWIGKIGVGKKEGTQG